MDPDLIILDLELEAAARDSRFRAAGRLRLADFKVNVTEALLSSHRQLLASLAAPDPGIVTVYSE